VNTDLPLLPVLAALVGGYLLGSIPFGLVLSRLAGLGDIRAVGSGNIGATNVLRTGRKDVALATLLLDAGKGAVAVLVASQWGGPYALIAGVASVLGHCTSFWVGFRGGKGVATGLGTVLAWSWIVGGLCCAAWLIGAALTRRSSAAALLAFLAAPVLMLWLESPALALAAALVSLLVIGRHHANIRRLAAGTEPRIGAK
jgi:glycerol-3-phosphate acyltransferase PlsY